MTDARGNMTDEQKDLHCLHFFLQIVANAVRPIPKLTLFKMFRERSNHGLSDTHLYYRIPKMLKILENSLVYTPEQKARFLFVTSTPVTQQLLQQIEADAKVCLNGEQQIIKYTSKDEKVTFHGVHKKPWHVRQAEKARLKKPPAFRKPETKNSTSDNVLVTHHVVGESDEELSDDGVEEVPIEVQENQRNIIPPSQNKPEIVEQLERPPRNVTPVEVKPELLPNHHSLLNNQVPEVPPALFGSPNLQVPPVMKTNSEIPQWSSQSPFAGFRPQIVMGPGFTAHYTPHSFTVPNTFFGQLQEPGTSSSSAFSKREDSSSTVCTVFGQTPPASNFFAQILKGIHHFLFEVLETSLPNLGKLAKEAKHEGLGMGMTVDSIKAYTIVYVNKLFKKKESGDCETEEHWKLKEVLGEFGEQINGMDEPLKAKLLPVISQRIQNCGQNDLIRKTCIMEVFGDMVAELEGNVKAGI
ncbi:unnamed protein product [Caenorhabditis brenneri]